MDLKLNDEQLHVVVSGAMLSALTPEERGRLISEAIQKGLIEKSAYSKNQSNLEVAVFEATQRVARNMAEEYILNSEAVKTQIHSVIVHAVKKVLFDDEEDLVKSIAQRIAEGFKERTNRY